jgi:hypothetical protein
MSEPKFLSPHDLSHFILLALAIQLPYFGIILPSILANNLDVYVLTVVVLYSQFDIFDFYYAIVRSEGNLLGGSEVFPAMLETVDV